MSKQKHKPARIRGGYNYRGFCIWKEGRAWVLLDDDGRIFRSEPTLRSMCTFIDNNYKELSIP